MPIFTVCRILSFMLGTLNLILQNFDAATQKWKNIHYCDFFLRNSFLRGCFCLAEAIFFCFFCG